MEQWLEDSVLDRLVSAGRVYPVRVTLLEPGTRERTERLVGVLVGRQGADLQVECLPGLRAPVAAAPATLEVAEQGSVYWARCELAGVENALTVRLTGPFQIGHRRRHQRLDLKLPVQILLGEGSPAPAELRDLSLGGASFETTVPCEVGAQVRLILSLGSGFFLRELQAEVVRLSERAGGTYVVAVQFQAERPQLEQLDQWLNRQLASGGENGLPSIEI